MQERESLRPQQLELRAQTLLEQHFGLSDQPAHVRYIPGCVGLMSEHTHFFDGFALMMPLPFGTAVAVRRTSSASSRLLFDGMAEAHELHVEDAGRQEDHAPFSPVCLAEALLRAIIPEGVSVEVTVVSTLAEQRVDAYVAALGVALVQAVEETFAASLSARSAPNVVSEAVARCVGRPFSVAYPMSVWDGRSDAFMLVDTGTGEWLPLEAPSHEAVGWGLVDVGCADLQEPGFYNKRLEQSHAALEHLQRRGFGGMASFRGLEHKDLQHALHVLPRSLQPMVRYLVSENRRVQKLVAAIRRKDWQMLGALLLISHASKRNDLEAVCPEADFTVEQVEQMLIDGMYGATLTGESGSVVVVGQPFMIPNSLDRIQESIRTKFDTTRETVLL